MEVCFIPFRLISSDTHESYNIQEVRNPVDPFMNARVPQKAMEWPTDGQSLYSNETVAHMEVRIDLFREDGAFIQNNATFVQDGSGRTRKHSRTWEHPSQLHGEISFRGGQSLIET
jgi:hypothetical protein